MTNFERWESFLTRKRIKYKIVENKKKEKAIWVKFRKQLHGANMFIKPDKNKISIGGFKLGTDMKLVDKKTPVTFCFINGKLRLYYKNWNMSRSITGWWNMAGVHHRIVEPRGVNRRRLKAILEFYLLMNKVNSGSLLKAAYPGLNNVPVVTKWAKTVVVPKSMSRFLSDPKSDLSKLSRLVFGYQNDGFKKKVASRTMKDNELQLFYAMRGLVDKSLIEQIWLFGHGYYSNTDKLRDKFNYIKRTEGKEACNEAAKLFLKDGWVKWQVGIIDNPLRNRKDIYYIRDVV